MRLRVRISDRNILPYDREAYNTLLASFNGKDAEIELTDPDAKKGKLKKWAYYRGVLLPIFHRELRNRGINIDLGSTHTFYCMQKFGKDILLNPITGVPEEVVTSQSDWTAERLSQFIDDLVIDLMEEFGLEAPDSAEYLADLEKKKKLRNLRIIYAQQRDNA